MGILRGESNKHRQNKDMNTPNYYLSSNGEDLISRFEKGLMKHDECRGFLKGNAFKYLERYLYKDQIRSDLYKLLDYVNRLVSLEITYSDKDNQKAVNKVKTNVKALDKADNVRARYHDIIFHLLSGYDKADIGGTIKIKHDLLMMRAMVKELIYLELGESVA